MTVYGILLGIYNSIYSIIMEDASLGVKIANIITSNLIFLVLMILVVSSLVCISLSHRCSLIRNCTLSFPLFETGRLLRMASLDKIIESHHIGSHVGIQYDLDSIQSRGMHCGHQWNWRIWECLHHREDRKLQSNFVCIHGKTSVCLLD